MITQHDVDTLTDSLCSPIIFAMRPSPVPNVKDPVPIEPISPIRETRTLTLRSKNHPSVNFYQFI
jgi:hypothetical protein